MITITFFFPMVLSLEYSKSKKWDLLGRSVCYAIWKIIQVCLLCFMEDNSIHKLYICTQLSKLVL
jgi:hypothetical protein